jgi:hypothetical protein
MVRRVQWQIVMGWRTTQVASEHEVENKETVLIVLECVAHVDDKRMVYL